MEVKVERSLLSKEAQEDTEEKRKGKTEDQKVDQLAVDVIESVIRANHSLEQNRSPDEAHLSLADRKMELIMAEGDAEVEEEEWEMVNCSPEEGLDLVLKSDLTQAQTDSGLSHEGDGAVLKVGQVFIMDEEEDLEIGASEVVSLVVAVKRCDLEDTLCASWPERNQEESPLEGALQIHCLEKGVHAGTAAQSNVSGIISEEHPVYSVKFKQQLPHLPEHTTQALEESLGDSTVYKEDQSISASKIAHVEWKEASGPEDSISLDRKREKSPPLLQREMVTQSSEPEIQILMPPSVTPNIPETVPSTKRKTCHCCSVM